MKAMLGTKLVTKRNRRYETDGSYEPQPRAEEGTKRYLYDAPRASSGTGTATRSEEMDASRDRGADRTKDGMYRHRHERGGGRDRDTKQQRGRAVSPLFRQSARDEDRQKEREREREREREMERERNRESWGLRGGDAGAYRRDDKGQKDGGRRDAHGRHRDCYGYSRGTD